MHKQGCVHVHGLLVEIALYLIDQDDMSAEMLTEYRGLGTRSLSVHESKEDHRDAIRVLATAIETSLEPAADGRPDLPVQ